jgi:hypothetical protein
LQLPYPTPYTQPHPLYGIPLTGYNWVRVQRGDEMKFKAIPLLLPALMLVLAGCGGGISESEIEVTVEARLAEELSALASL